MNRNKEAIVKFAHIGKSTATELAIKELEVVDYSVLIISKDEAFEIREQQLKDKLK